MSKRFVHACGLAAGVLTGPAAHAQGLEWVKANYTKREAYVPMRDGVRLYTAIYTPKDRKESPPILLLRTPYSSGVSASTGAPRTATTSTCAWGRSRTPTTSTSRTRCRSGTT